MRLRRAAGDVSFLGRMKMLDHAMVIETSIRSKMAEWLDNGTVPAIRAIGDGECEDFATEVLELILQDHPEVSDSIQLAYTDDWWIRNLDEHGNDLQSAVMFEADIPRLRTEGAPLPDGIDDDDLSLLVGAMTHVWIRWGDMHFDATAPEGRSHFLLMPFFADQIAGYLSDPQRTSA